MPFDLILDDSNPEATPAAASLRAPAPVAIRAARAKLNAPEKPAELWPVLAAASLAAISALTLAVAIIIDPPPIWWTPMLGFWAWRGVSDERYASGVSGGVQA